jgi:digalactosyldiacylglycerol synthase
MLSTLFGRDIDAAILPSEKLRQVMLNQFSIGKPNISLTSTNVDEDDSLLDSVTPQSDLSLPGRYIHIVTTAALPWFTGTAVNPLLRAAYLHRRTIEINKQYEQEDKSNEARKQIHFHHNRSYVTLVIPWLELKEDQIELYNNRVFESSAQQEEYIRDWLRTEAKMEDAADNLEILFYPARYHSGLRSVFAMGDIMDVVPPANRDVCILEEPEHCNCKWVLVDEADIFFCC